MHVQSMCMCLYTRKETMHTHEYTLRLPIFWTPAVLNCPFFIQMETHGVLDSFQDGYTVSHLLHGHSKLLYLRKTWCMVENHSILHEWDA